MRIPILICAVLALCACGSKNAADNSVVAEENAAGQTVVTNDVTAIDAATGDAANMAPNVNYTLNEANLESGTNGSNTAPSRRQAPRTPGPASTPNNSAEPTSTDNAL